MASDRSTLTPLGPGGRPFARWRPLAVLLALVALVAVAALLLSDRAPGLVGDVSDEVRAQVERAPPETRAELRRAVDRSGVEESDTWAHVGLWAGATALVGAAMWSWPSLVGAVVLLVAASTGLELVQERIAPGRITETSDIVANLGGIALGVALVLVVNAGSGLPARIRRFSRRRADRSR
jgi:hypothetical protein